MKEISINIISGILFILLSACTGGNESSCRGRGTKPVVVDTINESPHSQVINIYIENSGSMAGYFNSNSIIKDIIKEYYDRISESCKDGDTIKLNYINTSIENFNGDIKNYLASTQKRCKASFTKIDDILSLAMRECNDSTVTILISDFCFTSNDGSLSMAASDITRVFTEQRKTNKDLCVGIYKYMSDFKGKYYPGGIPCNKQLPFYLWIFGNGNQVKSIVNLPIKKDNCGNFLLQPNQNVSAEVLSKNARMVDGNSIIVKEWKRDRYRRGTDEDIYSLKLQVNLGSLVLSEKEITNMDSYRLSEGYELSTVERMDNDNYIFNIITNRPSPGKLDIAYMMEDMPAWIGSSNFTGKGIPSDSTTLGIKDLIEGVYDSYHNSSDRYFTISITLK